MNKKIIMVVMVLTIMANMNAAAQGYPVIDVTNLATALENGYTMSQQLQTMYNTLKTSYDQLQQQIKSFESFDFKSLNAQDPLGSWKSINTYANRMMTYEQNIESIINKKDIKIGNGAYSLADVFTAPPGKTMQNMAIDGLSFVAIDPFESKLTLEEKAVFHQKYGMSFGNYMRINQMGEMLKNKSAEVVGYSDSLRKNLAEDRERLDSISGDLFDSESAVQQQQINNAVLTVMAQDMKTQAKLLGNIAEQLAMNSSQALLEKQAMQDELNINDLGFADGLIKMLNEMQLSNDYR
jgi:conjugal transfer/entry exclusion protein